MATLHWAGHTLVLQSCVDFGVVDSLIDAASVQQLGFSTKNLPISLQVFTVDVQL